MQRQAVNVTRHYMAVNERGAWYLYPASDRITSHGPCNGKSYGTLYGARQAARALERKHLR